MRIKLIANSIEAKNYISSLDQNGCDYAYFHGLKNNENLTTDNSWELKVFSKIENTFFKNSISENSKQTINQIYKAVNNLEQLLEKENPVHLDGMKVFLNVDSTFNNFLKLSTTSFEKVSKAYFSKFKRGLDDNSGEMLPSSKSLILGISLFKEDNKHRPFMSTMINKLGIEKATQFVINHEASHSFEFTNFKTEGFVWKEGITDLVISMKQLKQVSVQNENKSIMDSMNEEIKTEHSNKFPLIDVDFIKECTILNSELYADLSAVLLMRNDSIKQNNYSFTKTKNLIDVVTEGRRKEHENALSSELSFNPSVKYFHHCTVTGLDHLKSILKEIPEMVLTQQDIYKIIIEAQHVGMSRVFIAASLADKKYYDQLELIANIDYNSQEKILELPQKINPQKTADFSQKIIQTAGKDWYLSFKNKIKDIENLDIYNKSQAIWNAAINPPLYEQFIQDNKLAIEKYKALNSITKIMEKNYRPIEGLTIQKRAIK